MCNKEKFWGVLAEVVDKPSWVTDPNASATSGASRESRSGADRTRRGALDRDDREWLERFGGRVPAAPVFDVKEALENPFVAERECVVNAEHPRFGKIRGVAAPVRVDEPLPMRAAPDTRPGYAASARRIGLRGGKDCFAAGGGRGAMRPSWDEPVQTARSCHFIAHRDGHDAQSLGNSRVTCSWHRRSSTRFRAAGFLSALCCPPSSSYASSSARAASRCGRRSSNWSSVAWWTGGPASAPA